MSRPTVLLLSVAALLLVFACKRQEPMPSTDAPLAVLEKPSLLSGGHLDSKPLAGKVVLVNFWSPT